MSKANPEQAKRIMAAVQSMKKPVIKDLENAYKQEALV